MIRRANNISLVVVVFLIFFLVLFSKNKATGSDPRASLLVSESIIKRGTIKLDYYGSEVLEQYGYVIHEKNNHYYYYFPIGTSLLSVPFVAVAGVVGLDMLEDESRVQIFIASVTSVVTLLFLYKLAMLFLDARSALLISSVFWFGTSLSSAAGTALWSHNFATLLALLAVYFSIRSVKCNEQPSWFLMAGFLFLAYLCRPTMAILSPFVLLFLFTYSRVAAIKVGLFLVFLLVSFILFSIHEFGQVLPDYYIPMRLEGGYFYQALYGNLFSPARGVLIYSPFIMFAWLLYKYSGKKWGLKRSWLLIGLAWPVSHWLFISRFPHWWAGWSYGARFMTDVIPGLFLLTLYTWPAQFKPKMAKLRCGILYVSCVFAILVNAGQGLFNKYTGEWNVYPNIDLYPEYLFDWTYPQFLANQYSHASRFVRHYSNHLQTLSPEAVVEFNSNDLVYIDWNGPEAAHRWSSGKLSRLIFSVASPEAFKGILKLNVGTLGVQKVTLSINGYEVYSGLIEGGDRTLEVPFDRKLLRQGTNTLSFELPDARQPGNGDPRILALALKYFQLQ